MRVSIGHFYFKLIANGNLFGEYSHWGMSIIETECANNNNNQPGFIGTYDTIWTENGTPIQMKLEIRAKNSAPNMFQLTWLDLGKPSYIGEGFIVDKILIGSYKSN